MDRPSLALLLPVVALALACGGGTAGPPAPEPRRTAIMISIDGFRPDYLDRPAARRLRRLADSGVRAEYLVPAFPTKTFPNHFTIATGLFPEHHGIVANGMVDSILGRFTTADTATNRKPGWWGGEPIWRTAERQGLRAATMFWVGSEVPFAGRQPTYWHPFDPAFSTEARIDEIIRWLSLPGERRPDLVTLYLNGVDLLGHRWGPTHPAVDSAIAAADSAIGRLVDWLAATGRAPRTDLVVVSDHGMTAISPDRVIFLDDYVDIDRAEITDLAPATAIEPGPGRLERLYSGLVGAHPHLRIYRKAEVPARFRFSAGSRITPLVALADDGWTISTRALWRTRPLRDLGNHGYDNALPSMAAIFFAVGPSFRTHLVVPPFQNVHLYPLMARILHLQPAPNDGSLDSVVGVLR